LALEVEHVVKARLCDPRPADDFPPVSEAASVRERRDRVVVVDVFELLLSGEVFVDEVGMETPEAEHEDAEDHRDESADQTCPILGKNFVKAVRAAEVFVDGVVTHLVVVDHQVKDTHRREQHDSCRQKTHEDVKQATESGG